ncbi:Succinyl-CoA:(R)-benzylsuccinate CoA-transferase subunit BbsF [Candidatus Entotheonellaceae bacterium PAL068K]
MVQQGVLNGVRVLSLEQVHVLPWGTAFLADFGAEVIRVESANHMQDRRSGPFPDNDPGDEWWNEGGTFAYWARNKHSLCVEVRHPEGKAVFLKLAARSDIVTDNFRPGTMQRLGLDHESLTAVKPDMITLSCTAYGHTGPWRAYGGRARTVDAACGLSYLTGYEGDKPLRASSNYMDHAGGLNVAYALLLALYQRRKTGTGMRIDLSMYETGVSCIAPAVLEAQQGIIRPRLGTAHLWKSPHNLYPCQGSDRWIAISVSTDAEWQRLTTVMGTPVWAVEPRFATVMGRWQHRRELDGFLQQWTATHEAQTLMPLLQQHGIAAGTVLTAPELVADPHLRERYYFEVFTNPNAPRVGPRVYAGRPFRRHPEPPIALQLVSALGQHNLQILRHVAGLSEADMAHLIEAEVIASRPQQSDKPNPAANAYQGRGTQSPDDPHYKEAVQTLVETSSGRPQTAADESTPPAMAIRTG